MAKFAKEVVKREYPSDCGSHKSMIVPDKTLKAEVLDVVALKDPIYGNVLPLDRLVALKDKDGIYITDVKKLDDGMADPNRYGNQKARIKESLLADVPKPAEAVEATKTEVPAEANTTPPTPATA
jgi:hypothetical protein